MTDHEEQGDYEYILISWAGTSKSGKTSRYAVTAKRNGARLGEIQWAANWRQYVFFPDGVTYYSAGCLLDLADFIAGCNASQRAS